jgi:hypothetical protein
MNHKAGFGNIPQQATGYYETFAKQDISAVIKDENIF